MNLTPYRMAMRLGLAAVVWLAGSALAPKTQAEEWTKSYTTAGRPTVRVQADDASVRVSTGGGNQVDFRVEYEGYKLDNDLRISPRQEDDKVEIDVRTRGHWCIFCMGIHHRLRVQVTMPKDGNLQVETGDGSVDVSPVNGSVNVHTGDGSVKANGLTGNIDLHTNDGSITVDTLKGDMRLHTGDGHIEARNLDGKVDADSGDGHIQIEGRFELLRVKTGDGSVDARVNSGSKMATNWSIRTGDGSVDLALPTDFQANIDASTGDGHISMGLPITMEGTMGRSEVHGKLNGGGQAFIIHTGDGSIRLSKS